ncbi:RNase H domain-containing protein [Trichonephila clavipes]|nr:RNase H domain-containing protein [Trichonephila clavipes]
METGFSKIFRSSVRGAEIILRAGQRIISEINILVENSQGSSQIPKSNPQLLNAEIKKKIARHENIKSMSFTRNGKIRFSTLDPLNNRFITHHQLQADMSADYFASKNAYHEPLPFDFLYDKNNLLNKPFHILKLHSAIKNSKNTTPGADHVTAIFFKNLDQGQRDVILRYFQKLFDNAIVLDSWKYAITLPIPKPCKETLAICQALDDLVEFNVNLLVLSDSLSVLSALQNFSIKSHKVIHRLANKIYMLSDYVNQLILLWTPGHSKIVWNEQANNLARSVTESDVYIDWIASEDIHKNIYRNRIQKIDETFYSSKYFEKLGNIPTIDIISKWTENRREEILSTRIFSKMIITPGLLHRFNLQDNAMCITCIIDAGKAFKNAKTSEDRLDNFFGVLASEGKKLNSP